MNERDGGGTVEIGKEKNRGSCGRGGVVVERVVVVVEGGRRRRQKDGGIAKNTRIINNVQLIDYFLDRRRSRRYGAQGKIATGRYRRE